MWVIQRNDGFYWNTGTFNVIPFIYLDLGLAESNLDYLQNRNYEVKLFKITLTEVEKKLYFKDVKVGQKFKYKNYPSFTYVKTSDDYKICIHSLENEKLLHKLEEYDPIMDKVQVLILE